MSPRDKWAGLDAIDIETEEDLADKWAGLDAVDAEEPQFKVNDDPRAEESWFEGLLRTSGELGTSEPPGANMYGRDVPDERVNAAKLEAARDGLVPAVASLTPLGAGGRLVSRLAGSGLAGAGTNVLQGLMDTQQTDPEALAWEALANAQDGALTGLAFGGAGEAVAPVVRAAGGGLGKVASWLGHKANLNRVAASGGYGAQVRNLAQNRGAGYLDELGQDIERQGLHKGSGPLGFLPQPASTYLENAERAVQGAGQRMGAAEQQISSQMPQVDITPAVQRLEQEAVSRGRSFAPEGTPEAGYARQFQGRITDPQRTNAVLDQAGNPIAYQTDFADAMGQKRDLYDRINFARKGGPQESPYREQLHRDVAGSLARGSEETLDRAATGGLVDPRVAQQWRQANSDYGNAKQVEDFAFGRTYQELGNQPISLPGWLGAGATAAGTGSVAAGAAGAMAAQLLKTRGRSALAGTERGMQHATQWGANRLDNAADALEIGSAGPAGVLGGLAAPRNMTPAHAEPQQDPRDQHARIASEGRGDQLEPAITELVRTHPEAFGPYANQFLDAVESEDDTAIASLLGRLRQSDDKWRTQYLPNIMRSTAQQPGAF